MAAKLKPGGKVLMVLFGLAFVGLAMYKVSPGFRRMVDEVVFPEGGKAGTIDASTLRKIRQGNFAVEGGAGASKQGAKQVPAGLTTVDSYKYVPVRRVKEVDMVSSYTFDEKDKTVVFPINVWGGWAPIIAANNGFKPNEQSVFYRKFGFKVHLKLIDDPDAARAAYASGAAPILWGTLDMIALFAPGLSKDPRIKPVVCQQIDWSNGGDGIVARAHVRTINDLRGKTIVLAQNSPSHYYILYVLTEAGIQPREVKFRFTDTAFGAARAFVEDPSIDACVSWAPDIYKITDEGGVKGAHLLTTTGDANKLIADVWAVRSDFYRDHRDIVKGLVEGIFEGMDMVKKDPEKVARLMAAGFNLDPGECKAMMNDAHLTNFAENLKFFMDERFGANFDRTWQSASYVYKAYGAIESAVPAVEVKDDSILRELKKEGKFAHQKDEYADTYTPTDALTFKNLERDPILTKTIRIHFPPNSAELDEKYDPRIPMMIEQIGKLAEKFGGAKIVMEGNVDTSRKLEIKRKGARIFQIFSRDVQRLSELRAKAVKNEVLAKFPHINPSRIVVIGNGWDNPIDLVDQSKNRRVEVKLYRLEAE